MLAGWRLLRCNPFSHGGLDPVSAQRLFRHGRAERAAGLRVTPMILANVIESAFGPLISFFQAILVAIHSVIGGSWGWSIIGLTLLVRTVTMPLTIRQFKGMAQLRAHAPELAKIKQRYPDDKKRQQEETMKYYKEAGVNPLASCLPLLLQIPVFISLVYMLRTDLKKHICGAALKAAGDTTSAQIGKADCNKLDPLARRELPLHQRHHEQGRRASC